MQEGAISINKMAGDMAIPRQTPNRRLKNKGTTFAEVHDDLRKRMAMEYPGIQKDAVNETA